MVSSAHWRWQNDEYFTCRFLTHFVQKKRVGSRKTDVILTAEKHKHPNLNLNATYPADNISVKHKAPLWYT